MRCCSCLKQLEVGCTKSAVRKRYGRGCKGTLLLGGGVATIFISCVLPSLSLCLFDFLSLCVGVYFYPAAVAKSVGASNANKLYAAVCTVIVEAAKADCTADTLT